jgi:hypothetical protein
VLKDDVCSDVTDLLLGGLKAPHVESDACAARGTSAAANSVARFFVRAPGGAARYPLHAAFAQPSTSPAVAAFRQPFPGFAAVTSLVDTQS